MIEQVKTNYQLTNEHLRELIVDHDALDEETKERIELYINGKIE